MDGSERRERWRPRAKCRACRLAFTVYLADEYPHRQYQPDAVADAVAAVSIGGESNAAAAARCSASETSVRRWTAWIGDLASPAELLAMAQRIDPDAPIGGGLSALAAPSSRRGPCADVLIALEQLGVALVRRGVELLSRTGLARLLEWQRRAHGVVVFLVATPRSLSPAMAAGGLGGR